ncbi:MAG: cytochrome C oxidase subunit IV family protein [Paracoccaceae bacterium]
MTITRPQGRWLAWIASLVLLGVSVAATAWEIGPWRVGLHYAIAAAQAVLIGAVFMDIPRATPLVRIIALSPLAYLAIMFGFMAIDYATR